MIRGLREGTRGAYVQLLQLALSRAGLAVTKDGVFGEMTRVSLERFQKENQLPATGIVDADTQDALLPYLRGYIEIVVQPGDSYYFLAQRYDTTVAAIRRANPGVNPSRLVIGSRIYVPFGFALVSTDIEYTYYYLSLLINGLRVRFPFCTYRSIGKTRQGKDIFCIDVGSGEKQLMYNATHHANEWITTPLLLKFFEEYATAIVRGDFIYAKDAFLLYRKTRLSLIPMLDADGVDIVNGVATEEALALSQKIAAAFPEIPYPSGWKANGIGVDLNLNYPAQWERAREIKFAQGYTRPAPRDYVGPTPLSEPEAQAMVDFTQSNDFLLTISYHSQGSVIYWRFDDYMPPRALEFGEAFSQASGYPLETTPLVSGAAGYKDWFIQTYNRPGYTVEVGIGESPLPLSQFDEIYKNNIGILVLGVYLL